MPERSVVMAVGASLVALLFVLELVRQRRLREDYSLLWLGTAIGMLILSVWRDGLHSLSALVGIVYPPNFLFLVAVLFVLTLLLYFSTVITKLAHENKEIAQQVALLRFELEQTRRGANNALRESQQNNQGQTINEDEP